MSRAGQTQHARLGWRRRLWPVAPALLVVRGVAGFFVLCEGTGDKNWKPFWLGGDGLPPGPRLGRAWPWPFEVPTRLYRDPEPLPGRAFSHVALAYTESDHLIVALVVVPRYLPTPLPHQRLDFRANGVPTISSASVVGGTRKVAC